jgi:hypothetical protein
LSLGLYEGSEEAVASLGSEEAVASLGLYEGSEEAVACRLDGSEEAVDARIDARIWMRLCTMGGGCRLYDGSEEAVACTTARRRLSMRGYGCACVQLH